MIMLFVCVVTNVFLPQIGKQRKKAHVDLLKERKKKIQAAKESEENWSALWICMAWIYSFVNLLEVA